ncbi:NUDIX hydrolase [bacterium]|nr:MAG: NUDIX hydrolase [bacterium]
MSKIPKHAISLYKGVSFEVLQWSQVMFDNSVRTFEVAKNLETVSIMATVGDKIVVLYQKQPGTKWYYTLPGGYMDIPEESPRNAALRELREETGLKPKFFKKFQTYHRLGRIRSTLHMYIANDCYQAGGQKLDGGEIIKVKLYSYDEFLRLSDNPHFHNSDLVILMLQARLSKSKYLAFKKTIFQGAKKIKKTLPK